MERVEIDKKVNAILDLAKKYNETGSFSYKIFVYNPILSPKRIQRGQGNNANKKPDAQRDYKSNFGKGAYKHFEEDLMKEISNEDLMKVEVEMKVSGHTETYPILLREDALEETEEDDNEESMSVEDVRDLVRQELEAQQPKSDPLSGSMNALNDLLGQCFGGLSGVKEGGLGAVLALRDSMLKTNYETQLKGITDAYEKKEQERRTEELRNERDEYKGKCKELEDQLRKAERALERKEDECSDLEERIEELEKMKPEHSIAGVALTGIASKALESLALRHAGTIGKLMGVDKDAMLGMLMADNQDVAEAAVTPQNEAPAAVVGVEEDGPRSSQISTIKMLAESLTDEEFEALYNVMLYLDSHREVIINMANSIKAKEA